VGHRVRRLPAWVVLAAAPWLAHCAGRAAEGDAETARTRGATPASPAADPRLGTDAGGGAGAASATEPPIGELDCLNFREVHHRVDVGTVGAEAVHFTVTRDYEVRFPSMPFCMTEYFPLSGVLDSFALQTDGQWRQATLGSDREANHVAYRHDGPPERPWASVQ
jgi:hypothetical protein